MTDERRASVQRMGGMRVYVALSRHAVPGDVPGTISWEEHEEAWRAYDKKWRSGQSAERIAARGGFGYDEVLEFLGRRPATWKPGQ